MTTRIPRRWVLAVVAVAIVVAAGTIGLHWRGAQVAVAPIEASGSTIGSPSAKVTMEVYADFR